MVLSELLILAAASCVLSSPMFDSCLCTRELDVLCGSDGVTYYNLCLLNCENSKGKAITVRREGDCEDPPIARDCNCFDEYRPVCSTSGDTYPNVCFLECRSKHNSYTQFSHEGPCEIN